MAGHWRFFLHGARKLSMTCGPHMRQARCRARSLSGKLQQWGLFKDVRAAGLRSPPSRHLEARSAKPAACGLAALVLTPPDSATNTWL